jgi:cellulose synthase/poly-beta-1,6-N-acetylglucosamine synthase-like glycosyltransferase
LDYPKACFEVQVLDDSTDETTAIILNKVQQYQSQGLQIIHLHRTNRKGFKAGALQKGLALAKGEFICIFDADFVPPANFLKCTLPYFANEQIGMVQTRWDHINKNSSLLTHFQAFLLDAHFSVEQMGRNNAGYFINFSGTGGVWRKVCMLDAGGWHTDTLTEDFDLSYRAQLKGWKFKYLEEVSVPAELPPVMSALKTQQYRWIKGNAETARKHVKYVLQSNMPFKAKVHAFFHLTVGTVFISVFIASVLSIPLLFLKPHVPQLRAWFQYASFSLISLLCLSVFHYVSTVHTGFSKQGARYFFKTFPLYLSFSMGISLNNALAVAEGWMGRKSAFIRTPKFNIPEGGKASAIVPAQKKRNPLLPFEMLLVFYFLAGAGLAFYYNDFTMFPYHLMLAFGFGMMCYFAFKEKTFSG